jgi:uroporphyrinogen-III synthase
MGGGVVVATLSQVPPDKPIRVLVTRPAGQGSALADLLAAAGFSPIVIPTIEIAPPISFSALDAALRALQTFDWLIFTSANAIKAFAARAKTLNLPANPKRIAVIGPATAKAVNELFGRPPDLIPREFVAESLAKALETEASGASMLLVRAAVARDILPEALTAAGAKLTIAEAYRNVIPETSVTQLRELFATHPPDAITFTSASTAHNLHALLEDAGLTLPQGLILASIGPVTSKAMRDLGLEPTVEATESTTTSLVEALQRLRR